MSIISKKAHKVNGGADFSALKAEIKRCADDKTLLALGLIEEARTCGHICPNPDCKDGSGEDGTGVTYYKDSHTLYCGKCGRSYDAFDIVAFKYGLDVKTDFRKVFKITADIFGFDCPIETDYKPTSARTPPLLKIDATPTETSDDPLSRKSANNNEESETERRLKQQQIYADTQVPVFPLEDLLKREKLGGKWRGLPIETLLKFGCRFIKDWLPPPLRKYPNLPTTSRIIIPSDATPEKANYMARLVLPPDVDEEEYINRRTRKGKKGKIYKIKPKQNAGSRTLFNPAALASTAPIFCVEGQVDAMSIDYAGFPAVALGGKGIHKTLTKALKSLTVMPKIIILLDADESGRDAAPDLKKKLDALSCPAVIRFLSDGLTKLDCNEILCNDGREALKEKLASIVDGTAEEFKEVEAKIAKIITVGSEARNSKSSGDAAQAYDLEAELSAAEESLEKLNAQTVAAIERLRDCSKFDRKTVLSEEFVKAAAAASLDEYDVFARFKADVKNYGEGHPEEKVNLNDWTKSVAVKKSEIASRRAQLKTRINKLEAQIKSSRFAQNSGLNFETPPGYSMGASGVEKLDEKKPIRVTSSPVIISEKVKNIATGKIKYKLAQKSRAGKWKNLPPQSAATIFNARKIIDLAEYDLDVTSSTASKLVDYLAEFKNHNEEVLPMTYEVARGGWYEFADKEIFIDPRLPCEFIDDEGKNIRVEISAQNNFAKCLKSKGTLAEWKKAYDLAKPHIVARCMVATPLVAPLLKVIGERNALVYVYGGTHVGKTAAAFLATSIFGSDKAILSFDATKNALTGAAAEVNDYCLVVDEKQAANQKIEEIVRLVYSLGNGRGRARLNRNAEVREVEEWRISALMTGEAPLLADNTTGGAYTRLLSIHTPDQIISREACKKIRTIIQKNYGLVFPLVVAKILQFGSNLRGVYETIAGTFEGKYPEILSEHCRYAAALVLADALLNSVLTDGAAEEGKTEEDKLLEAAEGTMDDFAKIFQFTPTVDEIDDTARERDCIIGFIAQNQNRFISDAVDLKKMPVVYGELPDEDDDGFTYITVAAVRIACKDGGFDYQKLVADLVAAKFFIPDDKIPAGRNKPYDFVTKKIGKASTRCFRIKAQN